VPVSWLRAEAIAHRASVFVLGCNSVQFGSGVVGQVQLNPLLERIANGLAASDVSEFLASVATKNNPLVIDGPTIGALKETLTARTAIRHEKEKLADVVLGKRGDDEFGVVVELERVRGNARAKPVLFAVLQLGGVAVDDGVPEPATRDGGDGGEGPVDGSAPRPAAQDGGAGPLDGGVQEAAGRDDGAGPRTDAYPRLLLGALVLIVVFGGAGIILRRRS
jgi:hypothetical protein